jgi:hypothetical protein
MFYFTKQVCRPSAEPADKTCRRAHEDFCLKNWASVTRLGEFSHVRRLITLGSGLKITEAEQNLGLLSGHPGDNDCKQGFLFSNGI